MYTRINFKTKKSLMEAFKRGDKIEVFQPGPFSDGSPLNGSGCIEGPHYPEPHKWYCQATVVNSVITKLK